MGKHSVSAIRKLVKCGIMLSPEAGQALLDEIDRLEAEKDNETAWAAHYLKQYQEANREAFEYKAKWEKAVENGTLRS